MKGGLKTLLTAASTVAIGVLGLASTSIPAAAQTHPNCEGVTGRTLSANVIAFDMPLMWNRLGAQNINGMMYALRRDVVDSGSLNPVPGPEADIVEVLGDGIGNDDGVCDAGEECIADPGSALVGLEGNVTLRPDKRPRPLVLRMGACDTLNLTLTNMLHGVANPNQAPDPNGPPPVAGEVRSGIPFNLNIDNQVAEREISLRFQGTQLVGSMADDGSFVGNNASSLLAPGQTRTYTIFAPEEGTFVGTSYGVTVGGQGLGGNTGNGLWAVLNVGPVNSAFYRSQITREEMDLAAAASGHSPTAGGQPVVNYEATYPHAEPWISEGKADLPIINMVDTSNNIVHSDINAIVAYGPYLELANGGGGLGHFPASTYPLESVGKVNPTVPNRLEPFREFTIAFHDEQATRQAYPRWFEDPVLKHTLHGVRDSFMINYGSGGIGTEIISSRLRVGPMHDCVNCAYEEFFLTAFTVGDVGMLVDIPANFALEECTPPDGMGGGLANCGATGPKANYALFPDDPSNVHHSYTGDFTKFRNIHAGPGEQHVFHLHNHQWLFNANDDNSNYLDAQGIGPGSGYTYEINFGGSGNRNKTAGDAIFHCHFYPHFAQGMWEMWRIHDTFQEGTELQASVDGSGGVHTSFAVDGLGIGNGTPAANARALPDPEIIAGTPIPGVVPLPGKAMAPMPAPMVTVKENTNKVCVGPAPDYGLVAPVSTAPFTCPGGYIDRPTGSLADVTRSTYPAGHYLEGEIMNPGYPFWIAGIEHSVGQRPPTPPLDMITKNQADALYDPDPDSLWSHPGFADAGAVHGWDGGLPRFTADGYSAGSEAVVSVLEPRLDLSKEFLKIKPFFFPEEGTDLEQAAMAYHAERNHPSYLSDEIGTPTDDMSDNHFVLNGAKPVPGAPYNEPCVDDQGDLMLADGGDFFDGVGGLGTTGASPFHAADPRVYKAANVQFDAVFNKLGYHYPQQRIITLWQDVMPTIEKTRPPEPFVIRMNTFDCTQYVHSNVVPKAFELDDYQVRTPTDIIGQHIHLPKWDLTTADGAANGWNYEDGTLSPGMVVEVIHAINKYVTDSGDISVRKYASKTGKDGQTVYDSGGRDISIYGLEEAAHPYFGYEWMGARSTLQRWFADPVVNVEGVDRGLGIIFTHDHYGPSTHQQIGLYATVLIEPAGSKWVHNETGVPLYTRDGDLPADDGGPTSWQAAILTGNDGDTRYDCLGVGCDLVENHREFYFEYSDFQHAYQDGVYVGAGPDGVEPGKYIFDHTNNLPVGGPGQWMNEKVMAGQTLAYKPTKDTFRDAIGPSFRQQAARKASGGSGGDFPVDIWRFLPTCPGGVDRPCPEAISADDPGMFVANYRNESLAARIFDPNRDDCPDDNSTNGIAEHGGCQAKHRQGDLAFAMATNPPGGPRKIPELNDELGKAPPGYAGGMCTGVFCPPINDLAALDGGDPFTPMLRALEGDRVHVKVQAGGHEEEHTKMLHGLKWLQAGSGFGEAKNSGWRNANPGGISEQFSFRMPVLPDKNQQGNEADYAWSMNASFDGWVSGTWGILRSYGNNPGNQEIFVLPNNPDANLQIANANEFNGVCPKSADVREYDITAVLAEDALPGHPGVAIVDPFPNAHAGRSPEGPGTLVYNSRNDIVPAGAADGHGGVGPLHDPTAILYVETDDLVADDAFLDSYVKKGKNVWFWNSNDPQCLNGASGVKHTLRACEVKLRPAEPEYCPDGSQTGVGGPYGSGGFCDVAQSKQATEPPNGVFDGEVAVEPLVIRANAGECIEVKLANKLLQQALADTDGDGYGDSPVYNDGGSHVFEDLGEVVHTSKGLNADTDGDGVGETPVSYADVAFDYMPELAVGNAITPMVRRDRNSVDGGGVDSMTTFQTNMMASSACVGLHAGLLEYDVTRSDGTVVGKNASTSVVCPDQTQSGAGPNFQWYAGHIEPKLLSVGKNKRVEFVPTPIEFGGFNIMPADKVKQPMKGLVAAGVIYPAGSEWTVDPGTNTEATVTFTPLPEESVVEVRDFTVVGQKGLNMFYGGLAGTTGWPVENILGEGDFGVAEDSQDMGQMGINYGTEPMWFRFGVNPTRAGGNAKCGGGPLDCMGAVANAGDAYSNGLAGGADPETAVFDVAPYQPFRQHVLMPTGPSRGSTFDLHGHVWQRDPYVCPGSMHLGLDGKCDTGNGHAGANGTGEVGSKALAGIPASATRQENPIGMGLGGIESWFPGEHFEIVIPSAGGQNGVTGDYLFRDHMGLGNSQGLWGIVRVE